MAAIPINNNQENSKQTKPHLNTNIKFYGEQEKIALMIELDDSWNLIKIVLRGREESSSNNGGLPEKHFYECTSLDFAGWDESQKYIEEHILAHPKMRDISSISFLCPRTLDVNDGKSYKFILAMMNLMQDLLNKGCNIVSVFFSKNMPTTTLLYPFLIEIIQKQKTIRSLNVANDDVGIIPTDLRNYPFEEISFNNVSEGAFARFLDVNFYLKRVNFFPTKLTINALCGHLSDNRSLLREIDISGNNVGENFSVLVKALQENLNLAISLESIRMVNSNIAPEGAVALAKIIKNEKCALTALDIQWNDIGDKGLIALSNSLRTNTTLTQFYFKQYSPTVSDRIITHEGIQPLITTLVANKSVTDLPMDETTSKFVPNYRWYKEQIEPLTKRNAQSKLNWGYISAAAAFVRAQKGHIFQFSINPLLKTILKLSGQNVRLPMPSFDQFTKTKYFDDVTASLNKVAKSNAVKTSENDELKAEIQTRINDANARIRKVFDKASSYNK